MYDVCTPDSLHTGRSLQSRGRSAKNNFKVDLFSFRTSTVLILNIGYIRNVHL